MKQIQHLEMTTVRLPSGEHVPAFGMGTWRMGEDPAARREEIATLRLGLDHGAALIDTAEMYGDGLAEELVGEAISGRRDAVFLVTKVLPTHASRAGVKAACQRSLRRLKTDHIDLYLLHWPGNFPVSETMEAFLALQQAGQIRHYGVSNFSLDELKELWAVPGGKGIQTNQLLYNLTRRSIEWDLLPWLRRHRIPTMAYSPIEQAGLASHPELAGFADQYHMTAAQAALAWLLAQDEVIVIPKTSRPQRLEENLEALKQPLNSSQLAELDRLFPPPSGPGALEML